MKIQLKEWKVNNLTLTKKKDHPKNEEAKNSFDLTISNFASEDHTEFGVGIHILIDDKEFFLDLEMVFFFEPDQPVDNQFMRSDFVKINAPAIAFPYVRTFISNLTLQSGFAPIILPSVNFVQIAEKSTYPEPE